MGQQQDRPTTIVLRDERIGFAPRDVAALPNIPASWTAEEIVQRHDIADHLTVIRIRERGRHREVLREGRIG